MVISVICKQLFITFRFPSGVDFQMKSIDCDGSKVEFLCLCFCPIQIFLYSFSILSLFLAADRRIECISWVFKVDLSKISGNFFSSILDRKFFIPVIRMEG